MNWPEELTDDEKKLLDKTVRQHKKCWGTGRLGFVKGHAGVQLVLCDCVKKAYTTIIKARTKPVS